MDNSKPTRSPKNRCDVHGDDEYIKGNDNLEKFWNIVGSLLYSVVKTRPDIAVVASFLGSHVQKPKLNHLMIAKRTLRYLRVTRIAVLKLWPRVDNQLHAHADANWGGAECTKRRSRSEIIIWYESAPIYTATCFQKSVSLTSTEAEYITLSETYRVLKWLRQVLIEIGITQHSTLICQDYNGTIKWANSGHARHSPNAKMSTSGIILFWKWWTEMRWDSSNLKVRKC